jgi:hypothetical protein
MRLLESTGAPNQRMNENRKQRCVSNPWCCFSQDSEQLAFMFENK